MSKKDNQQGYIVSRINTQVINYSVYVMSPSDRLMYSALLMIIGGVVGLVFYGGLFKSNGQVTLMTTISNIVVFVVVGLLAIKLFMPIINNSLKNKRLDKLKKQFCDFAAALTNALASGMNMMDSLNAVYLDLQAQYSDDSLIVIEVKEIINGMNNNFSVEEMLSDFADRTGIDDIENFAKVFKTCYRTGGDIKSIVRRTTDIISEKIVISSEIETTITSNKLQMNIMNVIPIVIVLIMRLMSSEFAESFSSLIGVIGLTVCVGLTFASYKLGQKIMDIKG